MSDKNREIEDEQFNISFDDDIDSDDFSAENISPDDVQDDFIDDTDISEEYDDIDFSKLDSIMNEAAEEVRDTAPVMKPEAPKFDAEEEEDGDDEISFASFEENEEDPVFVPEESQAEFDIPEEDVRPDRARRVVENVRAAEAKRNVNRSAEEETPRKKRNTPTAEELHRENVRFWTFTAIIAVLVIAAILFILSSRGIIGGKDKPLNPILPDVSPSEMQSTVEPSTEEPTTEEPTTEEPTTEEPTTEEPTTEGPASVLDNYTNLFVVTGTQTLNVRKAASTDSEIIGILNMYAGGEITEDLGDWCHILSGGIDGYVSASFISKGDEAAAAAQEHAALRVKVTADSLNVRKAASTDTEILEAVVKGTVFKYLGEENGFYKIQYSNDTEGYVSTEHCSCSNYLEEAIRHYAN